MKNPFRVGVALVVIGFVGLLVLGTMGWGGPDGRWGHGPMMRGYGRHPMFGYPWPGGRGLQLPPVAGARTIEIVATDFSFKPAEVTVKAGEVVNLQLVNQGVAAHDLVVPSLGLWLAVPPGQSLTSGMKFDRPGEYELFCSVPGHREVGMIGRIIVTP